MKKILILALLFMMALFGSSSFAQETTEETLTTTYQGGNPVTVLKNSESNNSGYWYYQISGKFERSRDGDVYLVLQKTNNTTSMQEYFDLCHFQPGGGNTRAFNYPDCPGGPTNGISTTLFVPGYNYVAYLSDESKGMNSDTNGILIYFDNIPTNTGNDVVTISQVDLINDSYFEISGNISENISDGVTLKAIGSNSGNADTIELTLGSVSSTGNFVFSDSDAVIDASFETYTIQAVYNNQVAETYLYTNTSAVDTNNNNTNSSNNGSSIDPFADSQVVQDIRDEKGLVKQDCGYNLGPGKSGRMCGFGDFVSLVQRIIEYIFVLILPIAAIVFAYAGYLYITSGGNSQKRSAAKNAMTKLVIGIIVVMLAWLIVRLVLNTLGVQSGFTMFLDL